MSDRHQQDRSLLVYIQGYTTKHGYPPTVSEIRMALGYSTISLVHYHLKRLQRQGHVNWVPGAKRTLQVTVPEGEVHA